MTLVKICGVTDNDALHAACEGGADFIGLVLFPPSPRHAGVSRAAELARRCRLVPDGPAVVALTVNPGDAELNEIMAEVRPDWLQLHGGETSERLAEIKRGYPEVKLIKAVSVSAPGDVEQAVLRYRDLAEMLLLDAKPRDETVPGGTGVRFDWRMIHGVELPPLWALAGGLDPENAREAARLTGAPVLDVSSGVESARGVKDPHKILRFLQEAKGGGRN